MFVIKLLNQTGFISLFFHMSVIFVLCKFRQHSLHICKTRLSHIQNNTLYNLLHISITDILPLLERLRVTDTTEDKQKALDDILNTLVDPENGMLQGSGIV